LALVKSLNLGSSARVHRVHAILRLVGAAGFVAPRHIQPSRPFDRRRIKAAFDPHDFRRASRVVSPTPASSCRARALRAPNLDELRAPGRKVLGLDVRLCRRLILHELIAAFRSPDVPTSSARSPCAVFLPQGSGLPCLSFEARRSTAQFHPAAAPASPGDRDHEGRARWRDVRPLNVYLTNGSRAGGPGTTPP